MSVDLSMELPDYRKEFPILEHKIYLNSCSLGALSIRSRDYILSFLKNWDDFGASAWYTLWMKELEIVRHMVARLINADSGEIALGHSISSLFGTIASCFEFHDRNRVLVSELDFPSANYQWLARKKRGVETVVLSSDDGIHIPIERYRGALNDRTALISTSHVFYGTGHIQDVPSVQKAAREHGALCLFDAYQSTGQIPLDVKAMNIDMLASGGLKWLLGGPGITFLYIRNDLIRTFEPAAAGWFGTKNQFDFKPVTIEFQDNAQRFETGTPSIASVFALKGGLEIILEIGVETVHRITKQLTEELIDMLEKGGFSLRISSDPDNRSAIVVIQHENAKKAAGALKEQNIIVDYRNEFIRVSPFFYNTPGDLETFLNVLRKVS